MLLEHLQTANDDPTLKDTLYAPPGYQANLAQTPGTQLGTVDATIILRNVGNATATATGKVTADSPANWANQDTLRCTGTTTHEAVWRLDITIAGTPLQIPIFVDHSTGADAAFSSVKIQLCLRSRIDPLNSPGAELLDAFFDVQKVFTSPANTADRVWRAVMVPYVPGTTTPNPAMIVESQSVVPGRVSFSFKSKSLKRGFVQISGKVLVNGRPNARARVLLYNIRNLNKAIASTRTKRNGTFVLRKKFKKKTVLVGLAINAEDLGACPLPALPPPPGFPPNQGCKTATRSFGASAVVTARPKKR
jgi:hypothetical protein